jgi:hypothetical protein
MRRSLWICSLVVVNCCFNSPNCRAEEALDPNLTAARADARRDLQAAQMEANHFWQIEYPRRQRELNAAIDLTEREVKLNRLLLREWGPFDKFATGQPLSISITSARLCLRESELRLDELRHQRNDLVRFHSDEARLYEWKVADARARVVALEGGGVIEIGEKQ